MITALNGASLLFFLCFLVTAVKVCSMVLTQELDPQLAEQNSKQVCPGLLCPSHFYVF